MAEPPKISKGVLGGGCESYDDNTNQSSCQRNRLSTGNAVSSIDTSSAILSSSLRPSELNTDLRLTTGATSTTSSSSLPTIQSPTTHTNSYDTGKLWPTDHDRPVSLLQRGDFTVTSDRRSLNHRIKLSQDPIVWDERKKLKQTEDDTSTSHSLSVPSYSYVTITNSNVSITSNSNNTKRKGDIFGRASANDVGCDDDDDDGDDIPGSPTWEPLVPCYICNQTIVDDETINCLQCTPAALSVYAAVQALELENKQLTIAIEQVMQRREARVEARIKRNVSRKARKAIERVDDDSTILQVLATSATRAAWDEGVEDDGLIVPKAVRKMEKLRDRERRRTRVEMMKRLLEGLEKEVSTMKSLVASRSKLQKQHRILANAAFRIEYERLRYCQHHDVSIKALARPLPTLRSSISSLQQSLAVNTLDIFFIRAGGRNHAIPTTSIAFCSVPEKHHHIQAAADPVTVSAGLFAVVRLLNYLSIIFNVTFPHLMVENGSHSFIVVAGGLVPALSIAYLLTRNYPPNCQVAIAGAVVDARYELNVEMDNPSARSISTSGSSNLDTTSHPNHPTGTNKTKSVLTDPALPPPIPQSPSESMLGWISSFVRSPGKVQQSLPPTSPELGTNTRPLSLHMTQSLRVGNAMDPVPVSKPAIARQLSHQGITILSCGHLLGAGKRPIRDPIFSLHVHASNAASQTSSAIKTTTNSYPEGDNISYPGSSVASSPPSSSSPHQRNRALSSVITSSSSSTRAQLQYSHLYVSTNLKPPSPIQSPPSSQDPRRHYLSTFDIPPSSSVTTSPSTGNSSTPVSSLDAAREQAFATPLALLEANMVELRQAVGDLSSSKGIMTSLFVLDEVIRRRPVTQRELKQLKEEQRLALLLQFQPSSTSGTSSEDLPMVKPDRDTTPSLTSPHRTTPSLLSPPGQATSALSSNSSTLSSVTVRPGAPDVLVDPSFNPPSSLRPPSSSSTSSSASSSVSSSSSPSNISPLPPRAMSQTGRIPTTQSSSPQTTSATTIPQPSSSSSSATSSSWSWLPTTRSLSTALPTLPVQASGLLSGVMSFGRSSSTLSLRGPPQDGFGTRAIDTSESPMVTRASTSRERSKTVTLPSLPSSDITDRSALGLRHSVGSSVSNPGIGVIHSSTRDVTNRNGSHRSVRVQEGVPMTVVEHDDTGSIQSGATATALGNQNNSNLYSSNNNNTPNVSNVTEEALTPTPFALVIDENYFTSDNERPS